MGNHFIQLNENFLKVHPDLAALLKEIKAKKRAIKKLKLEQAQLKDEIKSTQKELERRIASLENWQMKGKVSSQPNRKSARATKRAK